MLALLFIAALLAFAGGAITDSQDYFNEIESHFNKKRSQLESSVFLSYDENRNPYPSIWYEYDDFIAALRPIAVGGLGGGDVAKFFYVGQTDNLGVVNGLVNVAAFLAHAHVVSIKYDACDEFNVDKTDFTEKYAISNSCGQWGRSYQDEVCVGNDAYMTCDVDVDIAMSAVTSLNEKKAPPPFYCKPKKSATDFTGHWDRSTGTLDETLPFSNRRGRVDTAGCCWFGRGVLLTRGTCKFGRLNHFLGREAAAQGFLNFVDVDFCNYPSVVCQGEDSRNLRWSVGMFEWADAVQTYRDATSGEEYLSALNKFVEGGFANVNDFIDLVGYALPFGCFETNCEAAETKVQEERRKMFQNILFNVLQVPELVEVDITTSSSPSPTRQVVVPDPTPRPTMAPIKAVDPPSPPPLAEVSTPSPTPIPTPNPTVDPTLKPTVVRPTIPQQINAGPFTNNPTDIPIPSDTDLIGLQPAAASTVEKGRISLMLGWCLLCFIIS